MLLISLCPKWYVYMRLDFILDVYMWVWGKRELQLLSQYIRPLVNLFNYYIVEIVIAALFYFPAYFVACCYCTLFSYMFIFLVLACVVVHIVRFLCTHTHIYFFCSVFIMKRNFLRKICIPFSTFFCSFYCVLHSVWFFLLTLNTNDKMGYLLGNNYSEMKCKCKS